MRPTQECWGSFFSPVTRRWGRALALEAGGLVLTTRPPLPLCASGKAPSPLWASTSPPGNMGISSKMTETCKMGTTTSSTPQGAERAPCLYSPWQQAGRPASAQELVLCFYRDYHVSVCVLMGCLALQQPETQTSAQTHPSLRQRPGRSDIVILPLLLFGKEKSDRAEDFQTNSTTSSDHNSATWPHRLKEKCYFRWCPPESRGWARSPLGSHLALRYGVKAFCAARLGLKIYTGV